MNGNKISCEMCKLIVLKLIENGLLVLRCISVSALYDVEVLTSISNQLVTTLRQTNIRNSRDLSRGPFPALMASIIHYLLKKKKIVRDFVRDTQIFMSPSACNKWIKLSQKSSYVMHVLILI